MPVRLHAGASSELQYEPFAGIEPALAEALNAVTRPVSSVFVISLIPFPACYCAIRVSASCSPRARLAGACSIWSGPTISSTMTASPARVMGWSLGDVSPPVFLTSRSTRLRRSPDTSARRIFSWSTIFPWRLRVGRAQRKPSRAASGTYRRRPGKRSVEKCWRRFIDSKQAAEKSRSLLRRCSGRTEGH